MSGDREVFCLPAPPHGCDVREWWAFLAQSIADATGEPCTLSAPGVPIHATPHVSE